MHNDSFSLGVFLFLFFLYLSPIRLWSSVQALSHVRLFAIPLIASCQASRPSPTPGVYSSSCALSQWCHPTIWSSIVPFSSRLQSFPASGSFPMSWLFTSGGQSIGASASALVLAVNIQDWFPLGLTGLMSLQSKGFSKEFSPALQFKSISSLVLSFLYGSALTSIHDYWKNHSFDYKDLFWGK